eukprot:Skav205168  [mRNA]  locus=scaffold2773:124363:124911:- [translate_table: standard]
MDQLLRSLRCLTGLVAFRLKNATLLRWSTRLVASHVDCQRDLHCGCQNDLFCGCRYCGFGSDVLLGIVDTALSLAEAVGAIGAAVVPQLMDLLAPQEPTLSLNNWTNGTSSYSSIANLEEWVRNSSAMPMNCCGRILQTESWSQRSLSRTSAAVGAGTFCAEEVLLRRCIQPIALQTHQHDE